MKKTSAPVLGTLLLLCCNASPRQTENLVSEAAAHSAPVEFIPRQRPLGDLMGVNAIWGWGTGKHSRHFGSGEGPERFKNVATWARSYHNMTWDTKDPDETPDYSGMPESLHLTWVNWDEEYRLWKKAGLEIQACIQFRKKQEPVDAWDNPYQAAYDYGYAFARHFGPTHGNGYITAMEVGNEPWNYPADFYQKVLHGMAAGAKAADSAMQVLPAALQTTKPENENTKNKRNYLPARIPAEAVPFIDAFNFHHYSYKLESKPRRSSHPEDPEGSFQNLKKDMAYVQEHYPGKRVQVTEWGWGSPGGGDDCVAPECVSEKAQAVYAARGLFLMDAWGVDKAAWYFFHSLPGGKHIYGRCGLVSSKPSGWQKKRSFHVFETIKNELSDEYLLDILRQNEGGHVYVYGDKSGKARHIVAWLPVDAEDQQTTEISIPVNGKTTRSFLLDGNSGKPTELHLPAARNGEVKMEISATPVVLEME